MIDPTGTKVLTKTGQLTGNHHLAELKEVLKSGLVKAGKPVPEELL